MKQLPGIIIALLVALVVIIFFSSSMFYKLETSEFGVIFRQFSEDPLDKDNIKGPGFTLIAPWNDLIKYDASEQKKEEDMQVLDKNGLTINIDITIIYSPDPRKIGYLHEKFLGKYEERLIVPQLRASVRRIAGKFTAEEIYSTKRSLIEDAILKETEEAYNRNYVNVRSLLIRAIKLPENIKNSIEFKLTKEQEALAMKFVNEKERLEAERKAIEAQGIADFNRIVNASLNENILRQRGIEATLKLAESPNSKIVVVGGGENGLPLILNNN